MEPADYAAWVRQHQTLFALDPEQNEGLFREWWPLVRHLTLAELSAASRTLCVSGEGRFRADHPAKLLGIVRLGKAEIIKRQQAEEEARADSIACQLCRGTGMVIVPLPASVRDEAWVYPFYSCAVTCRCPKGRRRQDKMNEIRDEAQRPRFMDLDAYEARVGNFWPEMVCDRENRRRDEANADVTAKALDRKLGPLDVEKIKLRLADTLKL